MDRMRRLMHKGPGNNAKVSAILKDFEDADTMLAKIIDGSKSLRDAWVNLGNHQWGIAKEYQGLYDPIVGASDGPRRPSQSTPDDQLRRTFALSEAYASLKDELLQEVVVIDTSVVQPATDARKFLHPLRKTIKKREEKMVAYDKAQEKVKKLQKKPVNTPKEEAAIARAENDMNLASEEFQIADDHLASTLPPLCQASFNLIPCLLAALVTTENRLLGVYYTVLHNYCQEHQFPSPPPAMSTVVSDWSAAFQPIQRDVESFGSIINGKAVRQPMSAGSDGGAHAAPRPTGIRRITTGFSSKDKQQQQPQSGASSETSTPKITRIPSNAPSVQGSEASSQLSRHSSRSNLGLPTDFTTASGLGTSPGGGSSARGVSPGYTPSRERSDYFGHQSQLQPATGNSSAASTPLSQPNGAVSPGAAASLAAAKKKKPPPPPPPKSRIQPQPPVEHVVAEHDYPGGQEGDLAFSEGDRIRIIKKTDTMQDWWEGELRGARGQFPANYCRME